MIFQPINLLVSTTRSNKTLLATYYQSEVLGQRLDTRDELGFERRWCWWRCWWILTPSRWEDRWWWWWWWFPPARGKFPQQNSSARALDWFRQGSASWRRSFVPWACLWFFLDEGPHIVEDGHQRAARGPTRQGERPGGVGRAPTLVARVWAPSGTLFTQ